MGPAHTWLIASASSQTVSDEGSGNEVTRQKPHQSRSSTVSNSSMSSMAPAAAVGLPVISLPASTHSAPSSQVSHSSTSRAEREGGAHLSAMAHQARAAGDIFGLGDRHRASLDRRPDLAGQARRPQSLDLRDRQRQAGGSAGLYRWAVSLFATCSVTLPPPGSSAGGSCSLQCGQLGRVLCADCPLQADV